MRGQSTMWSGIVGGRGESTAPPARVSMRLHFVASGHSTDWKFVLDFAVSRAASHLSCTISLHLTPVLPLNCFPTRRSTSLSRKDWLLCVLKWSGCAPWFLAAATPPWLFGAQMMIARLLYHHRAWFRIRGCRLLCLVSTIGRDCGQHWEVR